MQKGELLQVQQPSVCDIIKRNVIEVTICVHTINGVITPCMKLFWFCHTNSRQLFCNCLLFVIALVPGLLYGREPDETCCHSVVASKWLKIKSALQDEILQLKHKQRLLRVWQFNV